MNHGYLDSRQSQSPRAVPAELAAYRYSINLYERVLGEADLSGRDVLEVSCGLGGGLAWLAASRNTRSLTGLDLARTAIMKCKQTLGSKGIRFVCGDAQHMPFPDSSFDIVLNVESSLNYPDMKAFVDEAARVLRPGGQLLLGDYRRQKRVVKFQSELEHPALRLELFEDVTDGVIVGMGLEAERKKEVIERYCPRLLQGIALQFAGLDERNNDIEMFRTRTKSYFVARLTKTAPLINGSTAVAG